MYKTAISLHLWFLGVSPWSQWHHAQGRRPRNQTCHSHRCYGYRGRQGPCQSRGLQRKKTWQLIISQKTHWWLCGLVSHIHYLRGWEEWLVGEQYSYFGNSTINLIGFQLAPQAPDRLRMQCFCFQEPQEAFLCTNQGHLRWPHIWCPGKPLSLQYNISILFYVLLLIQLLSLQGCLPFSPQLL